MEGLDKRWEEFYYNRDWGNDLVDPDNPDATLEVMVKNFHAMKGMYEKHSLDKNLEGKYSLEIGSGEYQTSEGYYGMGVVFRCNAMMSRMFDIYGVKTYKLGLYEPPSGKWIHFSEVYDLADPFHYHRDTFDMVISYRCENHFDSASRRKIRQNVYKVLKPNGIYIVYKERHPGWLFWSDDITERPNGVWVWPYNEEGEWITTKKLGRGYMYCMKKKDI